MTEGFQDSCFRASISKLATIAPAAGWFDDPGVNSAKKCSRATAPRSSCRRFSMKRDSDSTAGSFPELFKTKIVATIGPASSSAPILRSMIEAGMSVARLNFSHGEFQTHSETIDRIRAVANAVRRRVTIMADLPGPKIRIGKLASERISLTAHQ